LTAPPAAPGGARGTATASEVAAGRLPPTHRAQEGPGLELLTTIHQYVGYAIVLVVLVVAGMGFGRAKDAREFTAGPYSLAAVLLDIQVLAGLIVYAVGSYWEHPSPLVAYVHPALALLALGTVHMGLKRARRQQMAVDGHRGAARALVLALVLIVAAIGAVSVGLRA
jgi:hypothetical protein